MTLKSKPFKWQPLFRWLFAVVMILACCLYFHPLAAAATGAGAEQPRESVIAGSWYPASPEVLKRTIESFLDAVPAAQPTGELIALIAPHAGYAFSGPVAAHAYKQLAGRKFDSVIVIAPSHHAAFDGVSVYDQGGFRTPLGLVPLDRELVEKLKQQSSKIRYVAEGHAREHALEIQLPFLQMVLPGFKLVPLVMGDQRYETCSWLAEVLASASRGKSVLLVASSDLSHFHNYDQAKLLDQVVIDDVRDFNPQALGFHLASGKCEACGGGPIITALMAAQLLGANHAEVINYANSGDVTGDRSRVVGYLAAALYKQANAAEAGAKAQKVGVDLGLSAADKELLHRIARNTIEAKCRGEKTAAIETSSPVLQEHRGAFVTLKKHGELRGCIGHIIGDRPLLQTVAEMAAAAAFQDPRFLPVSRDELPNLDIEISVLTPPRQISNTDEIQVGLHGIILQQGGRSGLLLPQVASEYGWDRETFLQQTCRKAGLPADAWKDQQTRIYIFSAEVF